MKKLLINLSLILPTLTLTMEPPVAQAAKGRCNKCQKSCVAVCEEVKAHHKSLISQLHTFHKTQLATAFAIAAGDPCNEVESEGIENLYVEKEIVAQPAATPQKRAVKIFTATETPTMPTQQKTAITQYADIDSLLSELEKDLPKPLIKKLSLVDYSKELTKLVRCGASQTLALLKPETSDEDKNNLDDTCRKIEEKNNTLPDVIACAAAEEKNNVEVLRLTTLVSQAVESAKRLGAKEPLVSCEDDFTHPFNSYKNEIQLLQRLLTK